MNLPTVLRQNSQLGIGLIVFLTLQLANCGGGSGNSGGSGSQNHTLTVVKSGTGNGRITSASGINCGTVCSANINSSSLSLIAIPDSGSIFAGWSNNCTINSPDGNTCTVTVDADKTVSATFNQIGSGGIGNGPSKLKWSYSTGRPIYYASPAIAADGTIYVTSGTPVAVCAVCFVWPTSTVNPAVFALNPDGTLKWKYDTVLSMYSPSLGSDGTVYVQDASTLYAITPDGTLRWTYSLNTQFDVGQTAPAIGADGTVYVGADQLYAINPDGTLKWKNKPGALNPYIRSSPAIAFDGTIYVGVTGATSAILMAVNPDGTTKWNHTIGLFQAIFSSPAIGADGTVYFGAETAGALTTGFVYALNPDGTHKWRYSTNNTSRSSPAIGSDGTIYIGTKSYVGTKTATSTNAEFLALNSDGTLKWKYSINVDAADIYCSPAIGSDGLIYFGAETGFLYALNPDGTLAWKYDTYSAINWTSPAIAGDGTLYIGDNDGNLSAINTGSLGLANSPWPKFRHDNKNTGRGFKFEVQRLT